MTLIHFSYVLRGRILHRKLSLGNSKHYLKSWSVVFFGSDRFSLAHLKCLHDQMRKNLVSAIEVVVVNDSSPVYKYAVSNDFKTHLWPPDLNGKYDLGVIASFGKFIPENILLMFPLGIINVHGSLLPKWRGGMPVAHAVINGDTSTGITVTRIRHDKWDAGEIILQKSCPIGKNEVIPSLMKKLADLGTESLVEVLNTMPDCLKSSFSQSEKEATYAPRIKKEAAVLNWSEMTASQVFNLFRGLFGTFELRSTWAGAPVKFVCFAPNVISTPDFKDRQSAKPEPGSFRYSRKTGFLMVQCKDETVNVCSLKYNGKLHTGHTFYRGYLHKTPKSQWKFGN